MIALALIFVALFAFLIGFMMGVKKERPIRCKKRITKPDKNLINLEKEYHNFLFYDGSEQQ